MVPDAAEALRRQCGLISDFEPRQRDARPNAPGVGSRADPGVVTIQEMFGK